MLLRHGFTFESDTDTEVIPKLAKYIFDQSKEGEGTAVLLLSLLLCETYEIAEDLLTSFELCLIL